MGHTTHLIIKHSWEGPKPCINIQIGLFLSILLSKDRVRDLVAGTCTSVLFATLRSNRKRKICPTTG